MSPSDVLVNQIFDGFKVRRLEHESRCEDVPYESLFSWKLLLRLLASISATRNQSNHLAILRLCGFGHTPVGRFANLGGGYTLPELPGGLSLASPIIVAMSIIIIRSSK